MSKLISYSLLIIKIFHAKYDNDIAMRKVETAEAKSSVIDLFPIASGMSKSVVKSDIGN
jgi:hypothetical protein